MEAHSKIEEKVVKGKFVTITLTPESVERVVAVLKDLVKKSKPDRYEEFIIRDLMKALENPEVPVIGVRSSLSSNSSHSSETLEHKDEGKPEPTSEEKARMVTEIKGRLDPKNLKTMVQFVQESVSYGKGTLGIKTEPVDNTEESLFNWLYENKIIAIDGSPIPNR